MKFSLRWLGQYLDLVVPVPEMLDKLTLSGTEVEGVTATASKARTWSWRRLFLRCSTRTPIVCASAR